MRHFYFRLILGIVWLASYFYGLLIQFGKRKRTKTNGGNIMNNGKMLVTSMLSLAMYGLNSRITSCIAKQSPFTAFSSVSKEMSLSLNLFSMTHSLHQPPECFYRIIPPFADSAFCQTEDSPNLPVRPSDEVIHQHNL